MVMQDIVGNATSFRQSGSKVGLVDASPFTPRTDPYWSVKQGVAVELGESDGRELPV